jgi:micrococcal nuclease
MKKIISIIILVLWHQLSIAQPNVALDSVKNYVGKTIMVCAKVQSTYISKGEKKITSLSFGKAYPNHTFQVVIFNSDLAKFKDEPAEYFKDKEVCITGVITLYKDKPEIIVSDPNQIIMK